MNDLALAIFAKEAYQDNITSIAHSVQKVIDVETGTKAFILSNRYEQVVAFCGTNPPDGGDLIEFVKDFLTDINFLPVNGIHGGVLKSYKTIENKLIDSLDINKPTYFCGHSLGGNLATWAYFSLDKIRSKRCVTFGASRIFTKEKVNQLNRLAENITRYEAKGDPVPYLPPFLMGYRHIGKSVTNGTWFDLKFKSTKELSKSHSITNYLEEFHYDF